MDWRRGEFRWGDSLVVCLRDHPLSIPKAKSSSSLRGLFSAVLFNPASKSVSKFSSLAITSRYVFVNRDRCIPNGMYGGVRGWRAS